MKINIIVLILAIFFGVKLFNYQYDNIKDKAIYSVDGYKSLSKLDKDLLCLSNNIYMEAGTEAIEGKIAVAIVTMNRVKSKKYKVTVCDVVYEDSQFSWTKDIPKNRKNFLNRNERQYKDSEQVARKILITKFTVDELNNVLYYHADYVKPNWDYNKLVRVCKIGKHIFYRDKV